MTFMMPLTLLAGALFSHHVVGGSILLPGVGYVEMAFSSSPVVERSVMTAVLFLRPCVLP